MSNKIDIIVIDPLLKIISTKTIEDTLSDLQESIGGHGIEIVYIDGGEIMYVDEEGLYRDNQSFFVYTSDDGVKTPFAGKAIVLGTNGAGESASTKFSVLDISKKIEFLSVSEIAAMRL